MNTEIQKQYIASWHTSFVNFVSASIRDVDALLLNPAATKQDRHYLTKYREKLTSRDVQDIEKDLSDGIVKVSTISKIDKLHKELIDIAWDHLLDSPFLRQALKEMTYYQAQLLKDGEIQRLQGLQIPIQEG